MGKPEKRRRAPGAGAPTKDAAGKKVAIGVSRVAPDVAARIAAAPNRVAFLEALVRAAPLTTAHGYEPLTVDHQII